MAIVRGRTRHRGVPVPPAEVPSEAQLKIFFDTFEESLDRYTARKAANLSRDQFAELMQDPAFLERMEESMSDVVERVEGAAFRTAVIRGDKDAQKFLLQAKMASTYGTKASVTVSLTPEQLAALAPEELDALIEKLAKPR